MISIQAFGESFGALGSYLETGEDRVDPSQRVGWMEFRNLPTRRMDVAVPIMRGTASLSSTQQPVFHLSISWAPGDPVNRELMHEVMVQTLSDLGLREHQAVIVEHIDTDDPHVHAMVNRVHPETGVAWKGSWSKLRAEASLRRQELERGLRVVPGWLAQVPGAPELRPQPRLARGDAEFLREVQERAGPVLELAQSWSELEAGLSEFGLSVRVNGRGMSVTDGRREVKASEVGREFSRSNLEERFGRYSDYSARVAVASAEAARGQQDAPAERGLQNTAARVEGAAPELHPRFRLYKDGGRFGVWDCVGPQLFFTESREQALAEAQRASKIVARYPNIVTVRSLAAVDARWREAHGLDAVPAPSRRWVEMPSPGVSASEAPVTPDQSQALEAVRGETAAPASAHQLSFVPTEDALPPVRRPARQQRKTQTAGPQDAGSQQDDLWSQAPAPADGLDVTELALERSATTWGRSDAPALIFPIDRVPTGVSSLGAASTPERPEPAALDSNEVQEAQPLPHPSTGERAGTEPLVPEARRRQRKAKQSTPRSAPEAQADLWSQAPAPAETTTPAPVQGEEMPVRAAAQVQVEPAESVVFTARTTPAPDLPVPLEPVAAPAPPPRAQQAEEAVTPAESTHIEGDSAAQEVPIPPTTPAPGVAVPLEPVAVPAPPPLVEQADEAVAPAEATRVEVESAARVLPTPGPTRAPGLPVALEPVAAPDPPPLPEQAEEAAHAESALLPAAADTRSEVAVRIENIRRILAQSQADMASWLKKHQPGARDDGATPTDDSLGSQGSRASSTGRDKTGPATGPDRQRAASDPPGTPARHPSDRLAREERTSRLRDAMPPGGSRKLKEFLRRADQVLEQRALQAEIKGALTDIDNGLNRWSVSLDKADLDLEINQEIFHKEVNSTFRDPQAFWKQYESLSEEQQRKMLETLRDSPAAFAREFLTPPASEIATGGERPPIWRTAADWIAEPVRSRTLQRRVFLNVPELNRQQAGRAGLYYMGAVRKHAETYRIHAGKIGLPDWARPERVRKAIAAHVEQATIRKAEAIERCDALGQVPTSRELRLEFRGLRLEDRRWVQQQLRIVGKLIPQALSLAVQLVEGPERGRGGRSF